MKQADGGGGVTGAGACALVCVCVCDCWWVAAGWGWAGTSQRSKAVLNRKCAHSHPPSPRGASASELAVVVSAPRSRPAEW